MPSGRLVIPLQLLCCSSEPLKSLLVTIIHIDSESEFDYFQIKNKLRIFTLEKDETAFCYLLYQYCLGEISSLYQLPGGTGHFKGLILMPCKASCEAIMRQQCGPRIQRYLFSRVLYPSTFHKQLACSVGNSSSTNRRRLLASFDFVFTT